MDNQDPRPKNRLNKHIYRERKKVIIKTYPPTLKTAILTILKKEIERNASEFKTQLLRISNATK